MGHGVRAGDRVRRCGPAHRADRPAIAALLAVAAPYVLPEGERNPGRFDLPGGITATLGVGSLVYGFIHAAASGWSDTGTLLSFGAAAVLLSAFLAIELRSRQPLLPIHLFEQRNRWGSYAVMLMVGAAMFGVLWIYAATHFGPLKSEALVFPGAALLWLAAAFYLAMLGLVAEVALSSERESARETPTAWEVR